MVADIVQSTLNEYGLNPRSPYFAVMKLVETSIVAISAKINPFKELGSGLEIEVIGF